MFNMDQMTAISLCKEYGCCDACCLRYLGIKNPSAYEKSSQYLLKIIDTDAAKQKDGAKVSPSQNEELERNQTDTCIEEDESIAAKKRKTHDVCTSCIGVLQEESWPECLAAAKETMDKKRYECESFACALSAPLATLVREKAITLILKDALVTYDEHGVTALKEAWKWSAGAALARRLEMPLESGAVAPLLVTVTLRADDSQEEALLRRVCPGAAWSRRGALAALEDAGGAALARAGWPPPAPRRAALAALHAEHAPLYLGGRYIKRSRSLPQTPWVVDGRRVLPSSVQEIIFEPLHALFRPDAGAGEGEGVTEGARLKFISAGREDVDVRCLGSGRPFAVEVSDPRRAPSPRELSAACAAICASGDVLVHRLVPVSRERLAELKRGEETKCKTYEALVIKLSHTAEDLAEGLDAGGAAPGVRARDVARVAAWGAGAGRLVAQRTPVRVLHRRALHVRPRRVWRVRCAAVAQQPRLMALRLRTEAGTYVKEWAHGEARRSSPSLGAALGARVDILALDVTRVHLAWP